MKAQLPCLRSWPPHGRCGAVLLLVYVPVAVCSSPAGSSASWEAGPALWLRTSQDRDGHAVPAQEMCSDSATLHGGPRVESTCPCISDEMTATVSKHGQAEGAGAGALPGREVPSSGVRPGKPRPGAGLRPASHLSGRAGPPTPGV